MKSTRSLAFAKVQNAMIEARVERGSILFTRLGSNIDWEILFENPNLSRPPNLSAVQTEALKVLIREYALAVLHSTSEYKKHLKEEAAYGSLVWFRLSRGSDKVDINFRFLRVDSDTIGYLDESEVQP